MDIFLPTREERERLRERKPEGRGGEMAMTVTIDRCLAHMILATLQIREGNLVEDLKRYVQPIPPGWGEHWTRELAEVRSEIAGLRRAMEVTP